MYMVGKGNNLQRNIFREASFHGDALAREVLAEEKFPADTEETPATLFKFEIFFLQLSERRKIKIKAHSSRIITHASRSNYYTLDIHILANLHDSPRNFVARYKLLIEP